MYKLGQGQSNLFIFQRGLWRIKWNRLTLFVIIRPTCLPRMAWNTKQKPLTGVGQQNVKPPRVPWSQHIISLSWNQRRKQMKITTHNTQVKQIKEKFGRKDVLRGPIDGSGFENEARRQNLPPRLASWTPGLSVDRCRVNRECSARELTSGVPSVRSREHVITF